MACAEKGYMYVGNLSLSNHAGIGIYAYDSSGNLRFIKTVYWEISAGSMVIDSPNRRLYCVDERVCDSTGLPGGKVYSFLIDENTGDLTMLSCVRTRTTLPCSLVLNTQRNQLLVSNYGKRDLSVICTKTQDGQMESRLCCDTTAVLVFPIDSHGHIGDPVDLWSPNEPPSFSQDNSHLHAIVKVPGYDLFAVCDTGRNKLHMLRLEGDKLEHCGSQENALTDAGPRYCVCHPELPLLYLNCEKADTLYVFRYDLSGRTELVDTVKLPIKSEQKLMQSDLKISVDGSKLYTLVRGENSLVQYRIDQKTGKLSDPEVVYLGASRPKGLGIPPNESSIYIACAKNRELLMYDSCTTAAAVPVVTDWNQPAPNCIAFWEGSEYGDILYQ